MPFFERLNWNSIFECSDDFHVWYHMKVYTCANKKAKHTWNQNIQAYKNHVSADPMYIFSENGSNNLVPLYLWGGETLLKDKKSLQVFCEGLSGGFFPAS